ncbi:acyltransferase [Streptomyces sporangiiformans]|uniref:Acyltransferase n=1 Tax=Streptomyces sporangiiformans TaxID=2315329 RepID=A0A505D1H1_9ACTN|nr:acyltransferase [Streptomyces sporangiiformans]
MAGHPAGGGVRGVKRSTLELQGFRGLAALSTVVFHIWQQYYTYDAEGSHPPVENPWVGALISLEVIDLFFVMSAYLLTLSYARAALDDGSTRPARVFLFRRAVRILPLYFLAVLVVWASRNPTLPGDWRDLVEHLTFTHVFDRERIFYTLGPSWSLSLEIAFYFTLVALGPLAIRACRKLPTRRARVALCASGCLLLYAAPVAWITFAHYVLGIPHTNWPVYFGPQARFGGFAAGMALAVLLVALGERGRIGGRSVALLSALSLTGLYALSYLSAPENFAHTYYHPLAALLWSVLLFATLHVRQPVSGHALLRARWVTTIGLVSYSLYIVHEPVMLQLDKTGLLPSGPSGFPFAVLIVLAVALPTAVLSYWLIEYPGSLLVRAKDGAGRSREFYSKPSRTPSPEPAR